MHVLEEFDCLRAFVHWVHENPTSKTKAWKRMLLVQDLEIGKTKDGRIAIIDPVLNFDPKKYDFPKTTPSLDFETSAKIFRKKKHQCGTLCAKLGLEPYKDS